MKKILITGGTGYIGTALVNALSKKHHFEILATARKLPHHENNQVSWFDLGDLDVNTEWRPLLSGVDTIIHAAGRAHILKESSKDPFAEFQKINFDVTSNLARQAIQSGVKRFIFLSSIGVNGQISSSQPFTELSETAPSNYYAVTKLNAESKLKELASQSQMGITILRPPLTYSADAPGNFRLLLRLIKKGIPFPFALVENQRSFVAMENLIDFISLCIEHPQAQDETFTISDGLDFSTPDLIRLLSKGMNKKSILIPVPLSVLKVGSKLIGKQSLFQQLCCSLQVDNSKAQKLLGWKPVISADMALKKTAYEFAQRNG